MSVKTKILSRVFIASFAFFIGTQFISAQEFPPMSMIEDGFTNPPSETAVYLSDVHHIDKIYKSMLGPSSVQQALLPESNPPELLWITGYRVEVVGEDGKTPANQEFLCHNNLDFNVGLHAKRFGWRKAVSPRLFTISQAPFDTILPEGFGIPMMSDEAFSMVSQVLNHNEKDINEYVRHKVFIDFIRDRDLVKPLKPLFGTSAFVMASLEETEAYFNVINPKGAQKGVTCLPGTHAPGVGSAGIFRDSYGQKFTGHWVVKPGKEVRRTLVTRYMNVPFDTTVHLVKIHVHPFCEKLVLRDLNTGEVLFTSTMKGPEGKVGLKYVKDYSDPIGFKVYRDHDYELVSYYNNDSGVDQDAMATFFLYLYDHEFDKNKILPAHAFNR